MAKKKKKEKAKDGTWKHKIEWKEKLDLPDRPIPLPKVAPPLNARHLLGWPGDPTVAHPGLLADHQIRKLCHSGVDGHGNEYGPMISPMAEGEKRAGKISYGLTSCGYDLRVGSKFKIFTNVYGAVVDPKQMDVSAFVDFEGDVCIIPPNSFALAEAVEELNMPRSVMAVCIGKSTYARCGIILNITPIEPSWRGKLTLEISNTTPLPAKVYANEGIAQLLFFLTSSDCEVSYADKKGKYQDQPGLTLPQVD